MTERIYTKCKQTCSPGQRDPRKQYKNRAGEIRSTLAGIRKDIKNLWLALQELSAELSEVRLPS